MKTTLALKYYKLKNYIYIIPLILSNIASATSIDVDLGVKNYLKNHTSVKAKILSYGMAGRECNSGLRVSSKTPIKASSRWIMKIHCNGKWSSNISLKTEILSNRLIAIKDIRKGEKINPLSFKKEAYWNSYSSRDMLTDIKNKRSSKFIKSGTIIKPFHLKTIFLVNKGSVLFATLEDERIYLKVKVKALESGNISDIIKVENILSGKQIYGKITSLEQVVIKPNR